VNHGVLGKEYRESLYWRSWRTFGLKALAAHMSLVAIIQWARQLGFTLDEIRRLFFGFRNVARASERWQALSRKKLAELDGLMDGIKTVRRLLKKMMQNCRCDTLEQCGKGIFRSRCADVAVKSLPLKRRRCP